MHALIIEDEPLIAMSIEDVLRGCGCSTFAFARSLEQAILAGRAHYPDLITADVRLSPGCGIEAVATICGKATTPVVFVTGTADEIDARRPGSIIVHKPFDDAAIQQAVGRAMERARRSSPTPGGYA